MRVESDVVSLFYISELYDKNLVSLMSTDQFDSDASLGVVGQTSGPDNGDCYWFARLLLASALQSHDVTTLRHPLARLASAPERPRARDLSPRNFNP